MNLPTFLDRLFARICAVFDSRRLDADLDEELSHHLQALVDDNIKSGMEPDEALRHARVTLGGVAQLREIHREARGIAWFEQWQRDLHYAFRLFRSEKGFTAVAVIIVAIGVSLNTTVFSLVNTVLLRPMPFAQADRLVWITNGDPHAPLSGATSSIDTWEGLQEMSRSMDRIEGYSPFSVLQTFRLTGKGDPETISSVTVSHGLFGMLGVQPQLGRLFLPEDALKNAPFRVVLTHRLWLRRFGADPGIVGGTVQINDAPAEVIGVLPAADPFSSVFFPAVPVDFYSAVQNDIMRGDGNTLFLIGRMKPAITQGQVEADLPLAIAQIKKKYPSRGQYMAAVGEPLHDWVAGGLRKPLIFLWVSAGFVLAIVGFNLGGLLLARGGSRRREMALRMALGASRGRIIVQLLTECLGLVAAGSLLGGIVSWGFNGLLSTRAAVEIPLLQYLRLDGTSLAYTVALCLTTAIICGVALAWKLSGGWQMQNPLNEGSKGTSGGPGRSRTRNILVILEVALAFSLAVSATLMVTSLRNLLKVDLGFRPADLVAVRVDPPVQASQAAYIESALDRVRALPGVLQAGATDCIPVERDRSWPLYPVVPDKPNDQRWQGAHVRIVSPGLIRAMGTSLLSGRDFERSDEKGPPVIIVNKTLATHMWPTSEAVGHQVHFPPPIGGDNGVTMTVIGVAGDVLSAGPEQPAGGEFYLTLGQFTYSASWDLMVRTKLPVAVLTAGMRQTLGSLDPNLALTKAREMQSIVDRTLSSRRLLASLIGGFAAVAIGLCLLGLYGVVSYMVAQQTREIGIRMALGADAAGIQRDILGKTLALALCGLGIGLCGSVLSGFLLRSLLYGVSPNDATVFALAGASLLACAIGAGYLPARRASQVDPAVALRAE